LAASDEEGGTGVARGEEAGVFVGLAEDDSDEGEDAGFSDFPKSKRAKNGRRARSNNRR